MKGLVIDELSVRCEFKHLKDTRCFYEQELQPELLSTGWFQEQIQVWVYNSESPSPQSN